MSTPVKSTEALLASTIGNLHSDAFETDLCNWLASCLSYDNITALAYFQNRAPQALVTKSRQPKVHAEYHDLYLTGAYLLDPLYNLHIEKVAPGAYRLSDVAPDQFHRNRYFLDYYRKTTLVDEIAFVSYPSSGVSLHFCLGRDWCSKHKFTARDLRTAKRIAPLVITLTQAHWHNLTSKGDFAIGDLISSLISALKKRHGIALTARQAEVALLVLRGHSSVSIGLKLGISPLTVKVFRKQLYKRCKISSQAELFTLMLPLLGPRQIGLSA